jgi:hypothetical protein
MAGKTLGKVALTATERQRRWRKKKRRKEQLLAAVSRDRPSLRPTPRRTGSDFWRTEPDLAAALIQHVLPTLPEGTIWECAAGDGMLV